MLETKRIQESVCREHDFPCAWKSTMCVPELSVRNTRISNIPKCRLRTMYKFLTCSDASSHQINHKIIQLLGQITYAIQRYKPKTYFHKNVRISHSNQQSFCSSNCYIKSLWVTEKAQRVFFIINYHFLRSHLKLIKHSFRNKVPRTKHTTV